MFHVEQRQKIWKCSMSKNTLLFTKDGMTYTVYKYLMELINQSKKTHFHYSFSKKTAS